MHPSAQPVQLGLGGGGPAAPAQAGEPRLQPRQGLFAHKDAVAPQYLPLGDWPLVERHLHNYVEVVVQEGERPNVHPAELRRALQSV